MICILRVIDGPAAGMQCWLKHDQRLTIGRLSTSDFSVPSDSHMSRNHLIVEGLEKAFRLRDVGSSNGTFVNGLPISVVELCNGDHIKAGLSIFEVAFAVGNSAPTESLLSESLDHHVPTRTLGTSSLKEFSEDETMRIELDPVVDKLDAKQAWGAVERNTDPARSVQAIGAMGANKLVKSGPPDVRSESLSAKAGSEPLRPFLSEFIAPVDGVFWKQSPNSHRVTSHELVDKLIQSNWPATFSLIVNRSQLAPQQCGALDYALSIGEARQLTATLYLFQHSKASIVLEFYKHCLTKDAAVCIVSSAPLAPAWIEQAMDLVSYPSMFSELIRRSPSRAEAFAREVQFVLFEPHAGGEFCLLRGSV